jgi:hypothetical protein
MGFAPGESIRWYKASFMPPDARRWQDAGYGPDQALEKIKRGIMYPNQVEKRAVGE